MSELVNINTIKSYMPRARERQSQYDKAINHINSLMLQAATNGESTVEISIPSIILTSILLTLAENGFEIESCKLDSVNDKVRIQFSWR